MTRRLSSCLCRLHAPNGRSLGLPISSYGWDEETKGHVLELTVLLFPVRDGRLAVVLHKTVVDWLTVPNVHPTS